MKRQVVDLTNDAPPPVVVKKRELPQTITHLPASIANIPRSGTFPAEFTLETTGPYVSKEVLPTIKMIPGVKFDWIAKRWVFPLAVALNSCNHKVEPLPRPIIIAAQLKQQREKEASTRSMEETLQKLSGYVPDNILHSLAPFQREGVQFIIQNNGRALVADEMGLGKTRTAITASVVYRDDWPVLIVCPSSARYHWQSELLQLLTPDLCEPREITIIENAQHNLGKGIKNFSYKFFIISYNCVAKVIEGLTNLTLPTVIVDECHYMKNIHAQRTRCLIPLLHRAKRAILLSGTPALSRPIELFTQLHALQPKQWNNIKLYGDRYCRKKRVSGRGKNSSAGGGSSWSEYSGASNTSELHIILTNSFMIRRLKRDVLHQLPQKIRTIARVDVSESSVYGEIREMVEEMKLYEKESAEAKRLRRLNNKRNNLINGGESASSSSNQKATTATENVGEKTSKKNLLMQLFAKSGLAKLPALCKQLDTFLNNKLSGKILVFAHHHSVLDALTNYLRTQRREDFVRIDGQTLGHTRHTLIEKFQTSSTCRVALLAITAAGVAITLTAAATIYFAELYWTPAALLQAEDRAHRIGQLDNVKITYFLAKDTVDDILWPLVRRKMKLLGEFVEGETDNDMVISKASSSAAAGGGAGSGEGADAEGDDKEESEAKADGDELGDIEAQLDELAQQEKSQQFKRSKSGTVLGDDSDDDGGGGTDRGSTGYGADEEEGREGKWGGGGGYGEYEEGGEQEQEQEEEMPDQLAIMFMEEQRQADLARLHTQDWSQQFRPHTAAATTTATTAAGYTSGSTSRYTGVNTANVNATNSNVAMPALPSISAMYPQSAPAAAGSSNNTMMMRPYAGVQQGSSSSSHYNSQYNSSSGSYRRSESAVIDLLGDDSATVPPAFSRSFTTTGGNSGSAIGRSAAAAAAFGSARGAHSNGYVIDLVDLDDDVTDPPSAAATCSRVSAEDMSSSYDYLASDDAFFGSKSNPMISADIPLTTDDSAAAAHRGISISATTAPPPPPSLPYRPSLATNSYEPLSRENSRKFRPNLKHSTSGCSVTDLTPSPSPPPQPQSQPQPVAMASSPLQPASKAVEEVSTLDAVRAAAKEAPAQEVEMMTQEVPGLATAHADAPHAATLLPMTQTIGAKEVPIEEPTLVMSLPQSPELQPFTLSWKTTATTAQDQTVASSSSTIKEKLAASSMFGGITLLKK